MTVENENLTLVMQCPITITLADGKLYKISPILAGDVAEFEEWILEEKIRILDKLKRHNSFHEKTECDLAVLHDPPNDTEYLKSANTFKGMLKHVWYSLRQVHPEITEEYISSKLVTPESIYYVIEIINAVGGSPKDPFEKLEGIVKLLRKRAAEVESQIEQKREQDAAHSTKDVPG